MIRIVFYMDSGFVGAKTKEVVEFPDGTTEDEISTEFMEWISQFGGWWDAADGGEEE